MLLEKLISQNVQWRRTHLHTFAGGTQRPSPLLTGSDFNIFFDIQDDSGKHIHEGGSSRAVGPEDVGDFALTTARIDVIDR